MKSICKRYSITWQQSLKSIEAQTYKCWIVDTSTILILLIVGTCVRLLWRYMNNLKKKYLISCQCIHFIVHYWGVFCNKYQFKFKDRKRHIKWRLFYLRYLETDSTSQCAFCNKMKRFVDRIETFVHCNAWYGYTALNCADFFFNLL